MWRVSLTALVALCLCACSATSPPTTTNSDFATTPLGVATSTTGAFTVTMYGPTSGIVRGLNAIEIVVADASAAPVDGLPLALVPWMPAMGHGASAIPQIQAEGSGRYIATDVALIMPGSWELRASLDTNEEAVVTVEVQ